MFNDQNSNFTRETSFGKSLKLQTGNSKQNADLQYFSALKLTTTATTYIQSKLILAHFQTFTPWNL